MLRKVFRFCDCMLSKNHVQNVKINGSGQVGMVPLLFLPSGTLCDLVFCRELLALVTPAASFACSACPEPSILTFSRQKNDKMVENKRGMGCEEAEGAGRGAGRDGMGWGGKGAGWGSERAKCERDETRRCWSCWRAGLEDEMQRG